MTVASVGRHLNAAGDHPVGDDLPSAGALELRAVQPAADAIGRGAGAPAPRAYVERDDEKERFRKVMDR